MFLLPILLVIPIVWIIASSGKRHHASPITAGRPSISLKNATPAVKLPKNDTAG